MITNDLNMLLKGQALGLDVERHGDGIEGSFGKRYIVRPFQRYKVPLAILGIAIAVFAAILTVALWAPSLGNTQTADSAGVPRASLGRAGAGARLPHASRGRPHSIPRRSSAWPTSTSTCAIRRATWPSRDLASSYYEQYLEIVPDDDGRSYGPRRVLLLLRAAPTRQSRRSAGSWRTIPISSRQTTTWASSTGEAARTTPVPHHSSAMWSSFRPRAIRRTRNLIGEQAAAALADVTEEAEAAGQPIPEEETL